MANGNQYLNQSKNRIVELLIRSVKTRPYWDALVYSQEVIRTQDLVTKEEAATFIAAAHRKDPDIVMKDFELLKIF